MKKLTYNLENSKQSVASACNREQNNHNQTWTSKTNNTQLRRSPKNVRISCKCMSKRTLSSNPETQNQQIPTDKPINKNPKLNQFKVKYFEKNKNTKWDFRKNLQEISNGFNNGSFVNPNFIASHYESLLIRQSILRQAPKSQKVRQSPRP